MTDYITDEAHGTNWSLLLGDSCERLAEIETDSVDLSICSPPFASLFIYSPSVRDLGNAASRVEFLEHYSFIIREQLRVTKPGRRACIHVQQLTTTKSMTGYMGMTDFRGEVIRAFQDAGWIYDGEVTVWKDPQAQSIRTRSHALAFATKNRDSATTRPALADYLLLFKKPGENAVDVASRVLERFEALRAHGFSEEDIWDIGAITALFGLSNRMANLTSMQPNPEFYLMGRVPKAASPDKAR